MKKNQHLEGYDPDILEADLWHSMMEGEGMAKQTARENYIRDEAFLDNVLGRSIYSNMRDAVQGQTTENRKRNSPSTLLKCLTEKHAIGKLKAQTYRRKTYEHR